MSGKRVIWNGEKIAGPTWKGSTPLTAYRLLLTLHGRNTTHVSIPRVTITFR